MRLWLCLLMMLLAARGWNAVNRRPWRHLTPSTRVLRLERAFCAPLTPDGASLPGLKKALEKAFLRGVKRGEKLYIRLRRAEEISADGKGFGGSEDVDKIRDELAEHSLRQQRLLELQDSFSELKSTSDDRFPSLVEEVTKLGISEVSGSRKGNKKKNAKDQAPRKPYWTYMSEDGIQIRVGRGASDNDELSTNPEHNLPQYWWMHVSGFPGSHVVICAEDDDLPDAKPQVILDAALLTAKYSKAPVGGNTVVTMTRCRHVSKPIGAKPGLVQLSGRAGSIRVNLRTQTARIEELEKSRFPPRN